MLRNLGFKLLIVLFSFVLVITDISAQCPMCKAAAESNLKEGGTQAAGLNFGIMYLFLSPYVIIGAIFFFYWRRNKAAA